jgi:hypothetical protein
VDTFTRLIFSSVVAFSVIVVSVVGRLRLVCRNNAGSLLRGLVGGCVLLGLAACATAPSSESDVKKLVAERALARWQAMMKGDYAGAYEFLSPGSKASVSRELYRAKVKNPIWRDAAVHSVECTSETCQVKLLITYDYKNMKGIKTELTESWLLEGGNAWYIFRE